MNKSVAIDGPAGSGKSTVAKIISKRCNLVYIDTGAMYRAIAYLMIKNNIEIGDEKSIISLAENSKIEFIYEKVFINSIDVTKEIRSMEVTKIVSFVSSIVELRKILVNMQQKMAKEKDVIMEGRDITTVVLKDAKYKFYLCASLEARAKRRYIELCNKNNTADYNEILNNIQKRDNNDMNKEFGALTIAKDAMYIDTTNMTIDEVVNLIENVIRGE